MVSEKNLARLKLYGQNAHFSVDESSFSISNSISERTEKEKQVTDFFVGSGEPESEQADPRGTIILFKIGRNGLRRLTELSGPSRNDCIKQGRKALLTEAYNVPRLQRSVQK